MSQETSRNSLFPQNSVPNIETKLLQFQPESYHVDIPRISQKKMVHRTIIQHDSKFQIQGYDQEPIQEITN